MLQSFLRGFLRKHTHKGANDHSKIRREALTEFRRANFPFDSKLQLKCASD